MTKSELLSKIVAFLGEAGRKALLSVIDDEKTKAIEEERLFAHERAVKRAAAALCESSLKDEEVIALLHKHWGLNHSEAVEEVNTRRMVSIPFSTIVHYLYGQGYSHLEAKEFMESNDIEEKLKKNPSLAKLPPEKLLAEIKKK